MSELFRAAQSDLGALWPCRCGLRWLSVALLVSAIGCGTAVGCGCSNTDGAKSKSQDLVWRCTQSPALTLTDAWCSCVGYEPGKEQEPTGVQVPICDAVLPCCFIGPAPANRDGVVVGEKECRCVHDASCSTEMAKRQGVTKVSMCPPSDS